MKDAALVKLAKQCREVFTDEEAEQWAKETFTPHVSLVYSKMEPETLKEKVLGNAQEEVGKAGVVVGGEARGNELGGWKGGRIVLVQTWKPVDEWVPVAEKTL